MTLPLISLLVPAYNHEKYIKETIDSLIAQTYPNLELIVIDDGSKDNTFAVLKSLEDVCHERFANVHFETQSNQGTCITLNRLIAQAQGEYIYIIASDDVAKPHAIQTLYNLIKGKPQYVLAFCDNEIINADSEVVNWDDKQNSISKGMGYATFWQYLVSKQKNIPSNPDEYGSYASLLHGNYIPNGYLIRRAAILESGGYQKEAPLEDWYMHLQLSKIGKYAFMPEVLFSYRWHDSNTIKQSQKMADYALKTLKFERDKIYKTQNQELIELFDNNTIKRRVKLKLGSFLSLAKVRQIDERYWELCVGNSVFRIYKKRPFLRRS